MFMVKRILSIYVVWSLLQCCSGSVSGSGIEGGMHNRSLSHYRSTSMFHEQSASDLKEKILELQCYAKCKEIENVKSFSSSTHDLPTCLSKCVVNLMKSARRGYCPSEESNLQHKLLCLDNCVYDFDCPEVQKCCVSSCGRVCMAPLGLRTDNLLPPIPSILRYKLTRSHKVEITIESSANSTYYCHVEVRYHIGLFFSPRKLSMWQWQTVEKIAESSDSRTKKIDISFHLKPGHWYQVRVATINAYGFRGYSEPSREFKLPNPPKPPKAPNGLHVTSAFFNGKHYSVNIAWHPSKSNLPIEKYKIIWSLYVKVKYESFISNEAYVKGAHKFKITELLPDSSYYIQVQAMSISGSRRLKSEKAWIIFNTTSPVVPYSIFDRTPHLPSEEDVKTRVANVKPSSTEANTFSPLGPNKVKSTYNVRFRFNRKIGMIVQIIGFHPHREKVYELCPKENNCEQREYSAIRVKRDPLEFSKLKYDTSYILKAFVGENENESTAETIYTFTTPKCENLKRKLFKMQIKC